MNDWKCVLCVLLGFRSPPSAVTIVFSHMVCVDHAGLIAQQQGDLLTALQIAKEDIQLVQRG